VPAAVCRGAEMPSCCRPPQEKLNLFISDEILSDASLFNASLSAFSYAQAAFKIQYIYTKYSKTIDIAIVLYFNL